MTFTTRLKYGPGVQEANGEPHLTERRTTFFIHRGWRASTVVG